MSKDRVASALALFATALWWGSLTALGAVFVPTLFAQMATPADAGRIAARLFQAQTWLSVGCGMAVFLWVRQRMNVTGAAGVQGVLMALSAGLLLALLQEFAIAPRIVARDNLALWHRVGTALFVLQWVCAGWLLWRLGGPARQGPATDQGTPA